MPAKTIGRGPNPSGLCQCGCGQKTRIARRSDRGQPAVAGTPLRFVRGHQRRAREWDFTVDENGCWIWQGYIAKSGYGAGHFDGSGRIPAHRGMYELAVGPIPEGMVLDHLCRVKACVNPDHLEVVTPEENTQRGVLTKLTDDDVLAIRASHEPTKVLVERYGVSRGYIKGIRANRFRANAGRNPCPACAGVGYVIEEEIR